MSDLHIVHEKLEARRQMLQARIAHLSDDLRAPLEADFEEQATNLSDDEPMEALEQAGHAELARIEAALARLANGSYGQCARCGAEIAPARLAAIPEAALCIQCASNS